MKVTFLGASGCVTGSKYLFEARGARILVDYGLYQERDLLARNWEPFPWKPESINSIVLTHAHVDHCGLIPRLVRAGFGGRIFCTPATLELAHIVLMDSAHIQVEDAKAKRKRHEREGRRAQFPEEPLYTEDDVNACKHLFVPVRAGANVEVAPDISVSYAEAGHILGAAWATLHENRSGRTVVFSGDIGRWDKPLLRNPEPVGEATYMVTESTYGNSVHEPASTVEDQLASEISAAVERGGNVVIPVFAIERAHEMLYYLNRLGMAGRLPRVAVYLDSPEAISATEVFKRHVDLFDEETVGLIKAGNSPFSLPGLRMTKSPQESMNINDIAKGAVILAGSGMCNGGRVKHHLIHNISRPECTVLFIGYQAIGTLGRTIVDGAREVRIFAQVVPVNARIVQVHGFSGHGDREDLLRWASSAIRKPPRGVFVTHGEPEVSRDYGRFLREKKEWNVSVAEYRQEAQLE